MLGRPGYLTEFSRFWSDRPEVRKIWFSVYTPQEGEASPERILPEDRGSLFEQLSGVAALFPKVHLPKMLLNAYRHPPRSPGECAFARVSSCLSADLETRITPCQLGGRPVCSECGCIASAGVHAVGSIKLGGFLPLSAILNASLRIGRGSKRAEPRQGGSVLELEPPQSQ
jgi:hypothetical protein